MERAFAYYGTAFEALHLLMDQGSNLVKLHNLYFTLALEFVYICRQYNSRIDLVDLIEVIQQPLVAILSAQELTEALAPVFDIAFAPLPEAQACIYQLILQDQENSPLH